jgi:hypothetical protein
MPYLNLDPNYPDHPKTVRLISVLGDTADAYPIRLWAYCARIHPKDGALRGYSDSEIEAIMRWKGTSGEAVRAMTALGFLKRTKRGYFCTDWLQHQGHLEAFSRRARAAAEARWSSNASSMRQAVPKAKSSNAPTNYTNHTNRTNQPADPSMIFSREFLAFWDAYPRKMGQAASARAWNDLSPVPSLVIEIMGALAQHKAGWTAKATPFEYIPAPSKWLSEHRWKDELTAPDAEGEAARQMTKKYFEEVDGR